MFPRGEVKVSVSVDLPLSNGCQRALTLEVNQADRLGKQPITNAHLLLGLLDVPQSETVNILRPPGAEPNLMRQAPEQFTAHPSR